MAAAGMELDPHAPVVVLDVQPHPFERGQLIEVQGLKEEGFPASFVQVR
jgi:hypothetical protein